MEKSVTVSQFSLQRPGLMEILARLQLTLVMLNKKLSVPSHLGPGISLFPCESQGYCVTRDEERLSNFLKS